MAREAGMRLFRGLRNSLGRAVPTMAWLNNLLPLVRPAFERHPRVMAVARRMYFYLWQVTVRARTWRVRDIVDPHRTYWVDPKKMEYAFAGKTFDERNKWYHRGKVIGGDWDLAREPFADFGIGVYHGFEERFLQGKRWQDTEFYSRVLSVLSKGGSLWGCRTQGDLDERCRGLDALFNDIKTHGYRTQEDLAGKSGDPLLREDEITIRVARDGCLLFEDGQHRLAMAKLLDLSKVPVKITVRHAQWCQFKRQLMEYARDSAILGGKLYHPITHPDLTDIPSYYDDARFELMKSQLPVRSGTLLDIGANLGYFCHRFEDEGFDCYAVENGEPTCYFLEKLRIAENKHFKVIEGSILDYRAKTDFDVVLAMNIFHHFIKTKYNYHRLVDLLNRLNMRVMFFQTDLSDSFQMKSAYRNFEPDEFVRFILDNSNLTEATLIGNTDNKRPIYRLQA